MASSCDHDRERASTLSVLGGELSKRGSSTAMLSSVAKLFAAAGIKTEQSIRRSRDAAGLCGGPARELHTLRCESAPSRGLPASGGANLDEADDDGAQGNLSTIVSPGSLDERRPPSLFVSTSPRTSREGDDPSAANDATEPETVGSSWQAAAARMRGRRKGSSLSLGAPSPKTSRLFSSMGSSGAVPSPGSCKPPRAG